MDLFKPRGASSPRKPTDNKQQNGQVVNPPRYAEFGGLTSARTHQGKQSSYVQLAKPGDGRKVI
jgi:hypothetical protein